MHEVLVNRLGGLSLPRKSVVRLTDRPDMTLDVYRGHKTTIQQQQRRLQNVCCDTSLEPSHQEGSNEGSQHMFSLRNKKKLPSDYPQYPLLIWRSSFAIHPLDQTNRRLMVQDGPRYIIAEII